MSEEFARALARCLVLNPDAAKTEQEKAEEEANRLAWSQRHEARFGGEFWSVGDEVKISRTLAKQMGYELGNDDGEV